MATRFPDAGLVADYLDSGSPGGELVYLGFGETWTRPPSGLLDALADVPGHAHGYVISQYGLPRLQQILRTYVAADCRLPDDVEPGRDFETAAVSGGTRNSMFDFARLLLTGYGFAPSESGRAPVAVAPSPGWDYTGVFAPLGFRMRYLRLDEQGQPAPEGLDELLDALPGDERLAAFVVNAQHNPTGANWRPDAVRRLIDRALDAGAGVLVDDAYFGFRTAVASPTSALRALFESLAADPTRTRRPWLAVRSLGKQFGCNGWGIGAAVGSPRLLDDLVNQTLFQRSFAGATPLQSAMATWLSSPESRRHVRRREREHLDKMSIMESFFADRPEAFHAGGYTPFAQLRLPRGRDGADPQEFQRECLRRTGVLLSVYPWRRRSTADSSPAQARLYLGAPRAVVLEALQRLAAAGYV